MLVIFYFLFKINKSFTTYGIYSDMKTNQMFVNLKQEGPLRRSPEEKVKGHSGAVYRGPLMLSTIYWKRTSRWCYTSNMKALGLVVSDNFFLKIAFWNFWPRDLLMQPIRTIWTIFVGNHPWTIVVQFGQIHISGSREDVVLTFPYIIRCKIVTPGAGSILTLGEKFEQHW